MDKYSVFITSPEAIIAIAIALATIVMMIIVSRKRAKNKKVDEVKPVIRPAMRPAMPQTTTPVTPTGALTRMRIGNGQCNKELTDGIEEYPELVDDYETLDAMCERRTNGRYRTMLITEKGIIFPKLDKVYGPGFYLEHSMPVSGAHQIVREVTVDGKQVNEYYDPRYAPLLSEETPQKAYRAINWSIMSRVFAYQQGFWEKFNKVLIAIVIIGCFIVAIAYSGA